jgi:DNA-binding transcriptional MerR regulator
MANKLTSLGELALELKINKSQLLYYHKLGLINPIETVGRMNLFDRQETIGVIKKIQKLQSASKSLSEIMDLL